LANSAAFLVNPAIDALTFAITAVSLYYVAKQKPPQYPYVKSLLVAVHVFFEALIVLEFMRNFITTPSFIAAYTVVGSSLIFWDVVLLTTIAYSVYIRPGGRGILGRLRSIFFHWPHGLILGGFVAFIVASEVYLAVDHPYTSVQLTSFLGVTTTSTAFDPPALLISLLVLIFFLLYPTSLLLRETFQVKDPDIRRALVILPVCWVGIGVELLVFNGYLITLGLDLISVGYILAAVAFAVTATVFRRASLLSAFFEPPAVVPAQVQAPRKTGALSAIGTTPALLEVDSSTNYEQAVKEFAQVWTSQGGLVYVFTSKGSPVYNSLTSIPGVRFYIMTSKVSYPKPSASENEILVPQNDVAVLLDLLDKTISATADTPVSVVFDSISDFVLYLGFEACYKLIKQANEILNRPKVSSVYLMTVGAHEERIVSLTRSLFRTHMKYDASGLNVTRGGNGAAA
jgi:hypothetical protein